MALELIQKMGIGNPILEKSIIEKVGDGERDVFITADDNFDDIISSDSLEISSALQLGEFEIDGVKVVRKLGFVYLSDDSDKNDKIFRIVPALEYNKNGSLRTTIDYIQIYTQYNLIINNNKLIVVSYTETL